MKEHFTNMTYLYGDDIYVQIPNDVFRTLSSNIKNKNGSTNIHQTSFSYAYIVLNSFLYKYAHFVDVDNSTYIQNADIKEVLGYSRTTKSIDSIIKKDGLLDTIGLTATTKDYPIRFANNVEEKINDVSLREFVRISDINNRDVNYELIKATVKNRNYTIKEPTFLFEHNGEIGTLHNYANTHRVSIKEVIHFLFDEDLDNIDMMMYFFFKSKCKGLKDDTKSISLMSIVYQMGIGKDAYYSHLKMMKKKGFIDVVHKSWVMNAKEEAESNEYHFLGIR